ncbi:hypothetical protein [Paraburkholderia ultramafica]
MYWHPDVGALEVHGAIRECWLANGGFARARLSDLR